MIYSINNIPIVLHTMDSYSAYWDNWYLLFTKFAKNHGPIYFLTEDKAPSFVGDVIHIKTGAGQWGQRLLNGLDQIDSDLLFYMQEDFWPVKKIRLENKLLDIFQKYEMDCLKICMNSPAISVSKVNNRLFRYDQYSAYTLSHQFALWRKEFFAKNIYPHESPWDNEIHGTQRMNNTRHKVYFINNYWYEPVCRRGVLQPIGYKVLKKHKLNFFGN